MRIHQKEIKRLSLADSLVRSRYPQFGVNKTQEITRLLYEISKREDVLPSAVIEAETPQDYHLLKDYLLKRRYPYSSSRCKEFNPYLPKITLSTGEFAGLRKKKFSPRNIIIERKARDTALARSLKECFPSASIVEIDSMKEHRRQNRGFTIADYNQRRENLFVLNQGYDFFKQCPCTKGARGCGYHILNLGFGCVFDCTYCYLQDYVNSPGIILPANIESFFNEFPLYKREGMRLGSGEFTDSLALDMITGYSLAIIQFLRGQPGVTFEFKTKSVEIGNLLKSDHGGNIVVSWSLNPQSIIEKNEYFTPSLDERLNAAARCAEAGYKLGFHFDPIIYSDNWQKEYSGLIEKLFQRINPLQVAWISLGTFRFRPSLKQVIERRFPQNLILDQELLAGYDNKLRYPAELRYNIYAKVLELLKRHSRRLKIYLCMEEGSLWQDLKLKMPEL